MVQYFRNYIVRPSGSLSATSTIDSLSSSYICTANEGNILVPPPYSRAASPDPTSTNHGPEYSEISRSASQQGCSFGYYTYRPISAVFAVADDDMSSRHAHHSQTSHLANKNASNDQNAIETEMTTVSIAQKRQTKQLHTSDSVNFGNNVKNGDSRVANVADESSKTNVILLHGKQLPSSCCNLSSNGGRMQHDNKMIGFMNANSSDIDNLLNDNNDNVSAADIRSVVGSIDSLTNVNCNDIQFISHINDNNVNGNGVLVAHDDNYSNNSVHPSGVHRTSNVATAIDSPGAQLSQTQQFSEASPMMNVDVLKKYESIRSYLNSMTGSAVSSLANIDFPNSPPQATSPTGEIKELLEQIRQLQNESSPTALNEDASSQSNANDGFSSKYPCELTQCTAAELQPLTMQDGRSYAQRPSTLHQHMQQRKSARTKCFQMSATRSICSPISSNSWLGGFGRNHRRWASKSAPSTPDTGLLPDHSPLLNEHDEETEQST